MKWKSFAGGTPKAGIHTTNRKADLSTKRRRPRTSLSTTKGKSRIWNTFFRTQTKRCKVRKGRKENVDVSRYFESTSSSKGDGDFLFGEKKGEMGKKNLFEKKRLCPPLKTGKNLAPKYSSSHELRAVNGREGRKRGRRKGKT